MKRFDPAAGPGKGAGRRREGFTIVEVLMAIAIFSMVILGVYEIWSAVLRGSKAGLAAAAQAQRARISIRAIQDALVTAQMFSANGKHYFFLADTSNEKAGSLSFVARLPASFPGVGRYGDQIVRRVTFYTDNERNLIVTQVPMMVAAEEDVEPYSLQLAKDVTLFMFEFWDEQKKEYVTEWARTNQLPRLVRVALGLGTSGTSSQAPQDLVTCTIAMMSTAVRPEWQKAMMPGMPPGMQPGMQPGMPGMQPGLPGGMPGMPGVPGQLPGYNPLQPGQPGMPKPGQPRSGRF